MVWMKWSNAFLQNMIATWHIIVLMQLIPIQFNIRLFKLCIGTNQYHIGFCSCVTTTWWDCSSLYHSSDPLNWCDMVANLHTHVWLTAVADLCSSISTTWKYDGFVYHTNFKGFSYGVYWDIWNLFENVKC